MNLKDAEMIMDQFVHLKNKKIFFENSRFLVNEVNVQLIGEPDIMWKPIMICSEIDNGNRRKNVYDALFTLSDDFLQKIVEI